MIKRLLQNANMVLDQAIAQKEKSDAENRRRFESDRAFGLQEKQLAQQGEQFDKAQSLDREQFDKAHSLDREKMEMANEHFARQLGLTRDQFENEKKHQAEMLGVSIRQLEQALKMHYDQINENDKNRALTREEGKAARDYNASQAELDRKLKLSEGRESRDAATDSQMRSEIAADDRLTKELKARAEAAKSQADLEERLAKLKSEVSGKSGGMTEKEIIDAAIEMSKVGIGVEGLNAEEVNRRVTDNIKLILQATGKGANADDFMKKLQSFAANVGLGGGSPAPSPAPSPTRSQQPSPSPSITPPVTPSPTPSANPYATVAAPPQRAQTSLPPSPTFAERRRIGGAPVPLTQSDLGETTWAERNQMRGSAQPDTQLGRLLAGAEQQLANPAAIAALQQLGLLDMAGSLGSMTKPASRPISRLTAQRRGIFGLTE